MAANNVTQEKPSAAGFMARRTPAQRRITAFYPEQVARIGGGVRASAAFQGF